MNSETTAGQNLNVHTNKGELVGGFTFELAVHIVLNQTWKLSSALDTAESTTSPDTTSDELEWSGGNLGTSGSFELESVTWT